MGRVISIFWAVVVVQLVERSLPAQEIKSSANFIYYQLLMASELRQNYFVILKVNNEYRKAFIILVLSPSGMEIQTPHSSN